MKIKPKTPKGYRRVRTGTIPEIGDKFWDDYNNCWNTYLSSFNKSHADTMPVKKTEFIIRKIKT